jgi:hypothetical protein
MDRNVSNPYYSIITAKDFFGGTDPIRIIIIIYIILSLILNAVIFVVIYLSLKKKETQLPLAQWVMLSVLLMNFIHTFTYFFQWVIKKEVDTVDVNLSEEGNDSVTVGALLTGNPSHIFSCKLQGFLLIFSSISQDFLINIFFYLVNTKDFIEKNVKYSIYILGLLFPFLFTLFLEIVGAIGINDEFCYVKKFGFEIIKNNIEEYVKYRYFSGFQIYVMIVYFIRIINFCVTCYFLKTILNYVTKENMPKYYIFKSIIIPIIQLFTIGIGVLYRFLNIASHEFSVNMAGPYLILNTSDGVLFPIGYIIQNSIISQIMKLCEGNDEVIPKPGKNGAPLEFLEKRDEDED